MEHPLDVSYDPAGVGGCIHPNLQWRLRNLPRSQLTRDKPRSARMTRNSAFCKFHPHPKCRAAGEGLA